MAVPAYHGTMHFAEEILFAAGRRGPWAMFFASLIYFGLMYASFAGLGWLLFRRLLPALRIGRPIDGRPLKDGQIENEIRRSLGSIFVFSCYAPLTEYAYRHGYIHVSWDYQWPLAIFQLILLFAWNEVHFYVCHRLLHTRWLYRHVHRIHHESVVATPLAIYSFHWFEALLLGSVIFLPLFAWPFEFPALVLLPVMSLIFNTIGHSNYDVFAGTRYSASVEHSAHHHRVAGNYGFYLPFLDDWFGTRLSQ
ncbi:MAG: sterol desaturase family protein [Acidobacteria bacterium]|nr:sterol desaturase family protein [Acidobacteriota bacterium]